MNKKFNFILAFLLAMLLFLGTASAVSEVCCEKTNNGAWCIQTSADKCDTSVDDLTNRELRVVPSSCDATSYCKSGVCYDPQQGICMENTPQRVCQEANGVWREGELDELPQCQLGCCGIGDQAAFVTQTRCKFLSNIYGLETNFRTDFANEFACIASATSDVKGACVYEEDYVRTCSFETQKECNTRTSVNGTEFYPNKLCSSEDLGTNCGPTQKTTCIQEKDEVYFLDSCGNLANIYDANKINNKPYWDDVSIKAESCNANGNNAGSKTCGNCDYYLGSTCGDYKRGVDNSQPTYGDNICKDLSCEYDGETYLHGETWCADIQGLKEGLPGSRAFRLVCYNGDVTVEPCAEFRQEACIQADIDGFRTAACRVNRWQDCAAQDEQENCENSERRDCRWAEGLMYPVGGSYVSGEGSCVPVSPPGFDFWSSETQAQDICNQLSFECIVTYEKGLTGDKECVENCECIEKSWQKQVSEFCSSLGDCGVKTNFIGVPGFNNKSQFKVEDVEDEE